MAGNLTAMIAAIFSGGVTPDPYYEYTTLLLPGNGTNGAQNNTFLDGSTNNFTITRSGNTTQGTFSPFSQTGWGNYFNGSSQYLSTPDNAAFTLGSGDFTVEVWVYKTTTGTKRFISAQSGSLGLNTSASYTLEVNASEKVVGSINSGATNYAATSSGDCPLNAWTHIAFTRDGNTLRLYINGIQDGTASVTGVTVNDSSDILGIGSLGAYTSFYWLGYISNFRLVKGRCVYPSGTTFNPPTSPLTRTTGGTNPPQGTECSLLTCQSNRFLDSNGVNTPASSPLTITPNGSPTVVAFSPFNPNASWSAAANGGSGYFDGNGDYLTWSPGSGVAFGTSAFCVEMWFYPTGSIASIYLIDARNASQTNTWSFAMAYSGTPSRIEWANNGTVIANGGATNIISNAWNHIVYCRSGTGTNQASMFINGVRQANVTDSTNYSTSPTTSYIGARFSAVDFLTGYLSNIRIVNGSQVYDPSLSTLTVPTAPLTAIANTSLLLNFTNAGIYDATSKNDFETVGNAQISTAISAKWGSGSMYFDGTGDYLYKPYDQLLNQLNGNFTIECWIYPTTSGVRQFFAGSSSSSGSTNWYFEITSANKVSFSWVNAGTTPVSFDATSTASISTNTWTYVAAVKNGGTITVYINGSADGTSSPTGTYRNLSCGIAIGRTGDYNGIYFTGYIQDFRMSYYARTITASPTAAFPTL